MMRKIAMMLIAGEVVASFTLMACASGPLPAIGDTLHVANEVHTESRAAIDAVTVAQRELCAPSSAEIAGLVPEGRTLVIAKCIVAADAIDNANGYSAQFRQALNSLIEKYTKLNNEAD